MAPEGTKREQEKWLRGFQAIQSDHYLVFSNGPTNSVKKFRVSLERLYDSVKKEFPFEDINELLVCYIFDKRQEYLDFCVKEAGWSRERAERTGGHATSQYYATYYQSPTARMVMHEATHLVVGACVGVRGIGSWFQEGTAVYMEMRTANLNPSQGMRNDLRRGDYYPLEELFSLPSLLSDPKGNGRRSYRHAGALIDFLMNTRIEPVTGKFPELLEKARQSTRSLQASERLVREVYDVSLEELEVLWKEHNGIRVPHALKKNRR